MQVFNGQSANSSLSRRREEQIKSISSLAGDGNTIFQKRQVRNPERRLPEPGGAICFIPASRRREEECVSDALFGCRWVGEGDGHEVCVQVGAGETSGLEGASLRLGVVVFFEGCGMSTMSTIGHWLW